MLLFISLIVTSFLFLTAKKRKLLQVECIKLFTSFLYLSIYFRISQSISQSINQFIKLKAQEKNKTSIIKNVKWAPWQTKSALTICNVIKFSNVKYVVTHQSLKNKPEVQDSR